jgi:hypothetical protein
VAATGRFGLRVTPGGFGTPEFGEAPQRVRVDGSLLVVESGAASGASSRATSIDGATMATLAAFAGVDLGAALSVGHDTPPMPPADARLAVAAADAALLGEWFGVCSRALAQVLASVAAEHRPTMAQLWPEHFDIAIDTAYPHAASPGHRVNLGGSAGDAGHDHPYLYVGPWTPFRPGEPAFWNASFGATLSYEQIAAARDPLDASVAFFRRGLALLSAA